MDTKSKEKTPEVQVTKPSEKVPEPEVKQDPEPQPQPEVVPEQGIPDGTIIMDEVKQV